MYNTEIMAFSPLPPLSTTSNSHNNKILSSTQLYFGIPSFFGNSNTNNDKDNDKDNVASSTQNKKTPQQSIGLSGLVQLITAGMGSPFLGDFEGVDEETGKLMFSLEANNLVDEVCLVWVGVQFHVCTFVVFVHFSSISVVASVLLVSVLLPTVIANWLHRKERVNKLKCHILKVGGSMKKI